MQNYYLDVEAQREYQYRIFLALTRILKENNNDVSCPEFIKVWNINKSIGLAKRLDQYLHPDNFENINTNMFILWKNPFPDAQVGDVINGGIVKFINTFTVLIENI